MILPGFNETEKRIIKYSLYTYSDISLSNFIQSGGLSEYWEESYSESIRLYIAFNILDDAWTDSYSIAELSLIYDAVDLSFGVLPEEFSFKQILDLLERIDSSIRDAKGQF